MKPILVFVQLGEGVDRDRLGAFLASASGIRWLKASSLYRLSRLERASSDVHDLRTMVHSNQAVFTLRGQTELSVEEVAQLLGRLEKQWELSSPREPLRLVLMMYGTETRMLPELCLPDPELHSHPAKIWTAAEVAAEWMHPVLGVDLRTLANQTTHGSWGGFLVSGARLLDFS